MDNRPIGMFDSGLGGLTALKALRELMPDENIIYFGDTGRAPYGVRPVQQLRTMAQQDMEFAAARGVKAILAACGTVSSTAGDVLSAFPIPTVGVLRPAVEELGKRSGSAPIGVIATEASIKNGAYKRELEKVCPKREIVCLPTQDFVRLVETGHTDASDSELICYVENSLRPLKEAGISTLLLACTHFGIVSEAISNYLGQSVEIVGAADCAALAMKNYLIKNNLTGGSGKEQYFTSGSVDTFRALSSTFLGRRLYAAVEYVEPMEV